MNRLHTSKLHSVSVRFPWDGQCALHIGFTANSSHRIRGIREAPSSRRSRTCRSAVARPLDVPRGCLWSGACAFSAVFCTNTPTFGGASYCLMCQGYFLLYSQPPAISLESLVDIDGWSSVCQAVAFSSIASQLAMVLCGMRAHARSALASLKVSPTPRFFFAWDQGWTSSTPARSVLGKKHLTASSRPLLPFRMLSL